MKPGRSSWSHRRQTAKPYAMLGAGKLASSLWKRGSAASGWQYRFNIFRLSPTGRVQQQFRSSDVSSLVKLAKVLATELVNDGCLDADSRRRLMTLAAALDCVFEAGDLNGDGADTVSDKS